MAMSGLGLATGLTLFALRDNISYFRTPSDVTAGRCPECAAARHFRLGGLVEKGSLEKNGGDIRFRVTDMKTTLAVHYRGVPPDLFR
ncbi:MAG: cytochrome c maturation protein CcmE, partial [Pseudomonadota bacterium]|nr:cytochrome c maturation protein CcmE [Pseudomonadota bacterium]